MPNQMMVIAPYWLEAAGTWVFDDPATDLKQEPFVGSRFEVPRRLGVLAGAGKSLIDRSNGCTFVIGSVQQRPTKIHLGNVGLNL